VLQRCGLSCLDALRRHERAARAGDDEAIHQMRVAMRRLRAGLSSFSPFLSVEARRSVSDQLRWPADVLGQARNLDVFATEFLTSARSPLRDSSEFARLTLAMDRRRELAHAAVRRAIGSPRYRASVKAVRRWFDRSEWRSNPMAGDLSLPIDRLAPVMLERHFRKARKLGRGFDRQSDEQRHRLRIALKKLRYATELFGDIYDTNEVKTFVGCLKWLQDELGKANDLAVAREIMTDLTGHCVKRTGVALAGARLLDRRQRRLASNEPALRQHLTRLFEIERFWPRPYSQAVAMYG